MSVSPIDSSRRTMPEIIWSIRSGSIGRFCMRDADRAFQLVAVEILAPPARLDHHEIAQLDPFVGGEAPAAGRDRTAAGGSQTWSSAGRLSFTCVSMLPQNGQRIACSSSPVPSVGGGRSRHHYRDLPSNWVEQIDAHKMGTARAGSTAGTAADGGQSMMITPMVSLQSARAWATA